MRSATLTREWICRFVDESGSGAGNTNAVGDYSTTSREFKIQAPNEKVFEIHSATLEIVSSAMTHYGYMNAAGGLTIGVDLFVAEESFGTYSTKLPVPIERAKIHQDLLRSGADTREDMARLFTNPVATPMYVVHWDWKKLLGWPIVLRGSKHGKLTFSVNDNFASRGGIRHRIMVRGFAYAERYKDVTEAVIT